MTRPDTLDPLGDLPGYALRRAANAMMAELSARLDALGLRISDASVLMLAEGPGDRTSSEIGKMLDIQRANMVPLLNRQEETGLIERVPINLKSQAIRLTVKGRKRLAEVRQVIEEFEKHLMERIPEEHRPHFLPALQSLLA